MTPQEILIQARQLLIDKGWVPHPKGINGARCAGLAIEEVCLVRTFEDLDKLHEASKALAKVIDPGVLTPYFTIYEWNDRQTSITPILDAFDKAIASLES